MSSQETTTQSSKSLDELISELIIEFNSWSRERESLSYSEAVLRADAMLINAEFEHAEDIAQMVIENDIAMTQMLMQRADTVAEAMIVSFEQSVIRGMQSAVKSASARGKRENEQHNDQHVELDSSMAGAGDDQGEGGSIPAER